jgi:cell division protease FtsH
MMPQGQGVAAAEATIREIDLAVRGLVEEAEGRAREILETRRDDLEAGTALLMTKERLTAEEFPALQPHEGQVPKVAA